MAWTYPCQWAFEQEKGRLRYALLLDIAHLQERSIAKHIQGIAKSRGEMANIIQSLDAECRNIVPSITGGVD